MTIFVLNSGSSSIRFSTMDVSRTHPTGGKTISQTMIRGKVQGIGKDTSLEIQEGDKQIFHSRSNMNTHEEAFTWLFNSLKNLDESGDMTIKVDAIEAVGHRVVHGGDRFSESTIIDDDVLHEMQQLHDLAPLHMPACIEGIHAAKRFFGDSIPMVAVFDTTFHRTLPDYANTYAIPFELTKRHHIKRYGFHGIAHASLAQSYAKHTSLDLKTQRLITLQLGHGCSMTAIAHGKSIDTSMGFTPSEGLMMGTRSGDVDPSVISYLIHKEQVSFMGVQNWLNEKSGLLGVSHRTSDMRQLIHAAMEEDDDQAQLAIDMFCYRIQKYFGAYWGILGGADAVIFGGGIGEHAPEIRKQVCKGMEWCGLKLDSDRNQSVESMEPGQIQSISQDTSSVGVYVAGTDEETLIAEETVHCLETCSCEGKHQG